MIIGYARVSTDDQTTALQRDALKRARCKLMFEDKGVSGITRKRPALTKALKRIERGDVLTVWRLDHLGRSLRDLIAIIGEIEQRGAHFHSVTEHIDTTTASGKLVFHMMGALAEFERTLIVERTQAGLKAAKRRGIRLGRRPLLSAEQVRHAIERVNAGDLVGQTARTRSVRAHACTCLPALRAKRKVPFILPQTPSLNVVCVVLQACGGARPASRAQVD